MAQYLSTRDMRFFLLWFGACAGLGVIGFTFTEEIPTELSLFCYPRPIDYFYVGILFLHFKSRLVAKDHQLTILASFLTCVSYPVGLILVELLYLIEGHSVEVFCYTLLPNATMMLLLFGSFDPVENKDNSIPHNSAVNFIGLANKWLVFVCSLATFIPLTSCWNELLDRNSYWTPEGFGYGAIFSLFFTEKFLQGAKSQSNRCQLIFVGLLVVLNLDEGKSAIFILLQSLNSLLGYQNILYTGIILSLIAMLIQWKKVKALQESVAIGDSGLNKV